MADCLILRTGNGGAGSDDVTATANHILAPYTAITSNSNDEPITGTIQSKAATTYNTSTSDQTIKSGQYLSGDQTIKGVTTSNIDAGNIKKGVVVKVGDVNSAGRIKDITGTYTTVSSGQSALTAATLRKGYSGFANGGGEVKGNMTEKTAATYNTSKTDQTIAKDQYLTGAQTIKAVTTANISASNIKKGVTVTVGDANDADRIASVAGTYSTVSSGQTALTAASLRKGYSGFANGGAEVKGNMTEKAAQTYYATKSAQTIAKDQYLTGAQTIHALSSTNLTAGNIRKGVTVSVNNGDADVYNVTGTWYGNKEAIGVSTYSGSFGYADPETQEFTMPDSGIVYYGGVSCAVNKNGRCLCRIYKNGTVVDNRDIDYDWEVRASMYNKSFSAAKNDVIKVEVNCSAGDCVALMQAVIVY